MAAAEELIRRVLPPESDVASRADLIDVRLGQFSFSELVGWKRVLAAHVLGESWFGSISADESTNQVRIRVTESAAVQWVQDLADRIEVPDALLRAEITRRVQAAGTLRAHYRPTGGGLEIVPLDSVPCTLGWNVATSYHENGFLTAGHCQVYYGQGITGADIFQPGPPITSNRIGEIHLDNAWDLEYCEYPEGQTWTGMCTLADALFVLADSGARRVARPTSIGENSSPGSINIAWWWENIHSPYTPVFGVDVDKVGRSTGWTRGEISGTCVTVKVGEGSSAYVVICAEEVEDAAVDGGDSGAPVFFSSSGVPGSALYPYGILFAGELGCSSNCIYYFSAFDVLEMHLGRTFDTKVATITAEIVGPSEVQEHQHCLWSADAHGGLGSLSYEWRKDDALVSQTDVYETMDTGDTSFLLTLTVTDSESNYVLRELHVDVEGSGQFSCT